MPPKLETWEGGESPSPPASYAYDYGGGGGGGDGFRKHDKWEGMDMGGGFRKESIFVKSPPPPPPPGLHPPRICGPIIFCGMHEQKGRSQ